MSIRSACNSVEDSTGFCAGRVDQIVEWTSKVAKGEGIYIYTYIFFLESRRVFPAVIKGRRAWIDPILILRILIFHFGFLARWKNEGDARGDCVRRCTDID